MTTIDRDRLRRYLSHAAMLLPPDERVVTVEEGVALLDALEQAEDDAFRQRAAMNRERDRAVRAEAQSETRRQQTKYWKVRAEVFEAKMNELDRAYISEHGQRSRAEDEQDRLKNKLARRSETVSRLLEERNNAEARIQAVRELHRRFGVYEHEDACTDTTDEHREEHHHEDSDSTGEYYCDQMPLYAVCDHCRNEDGERADWQCPTIRALDAP